MGERVAFTHAATVIVIVFFVFRAVPRNIVETFKTDTKRSVSLHKLFSLINVNLSLIIAHKFKVATIGGSVSI